MNPDLQLALHRDHLQALHAQARRDRQAREARPAPQSRPRLQDLLTRLHLRARPA
ncbi:hypothetical protein [Deinococcus aestuarii]|uniref:hypothetical protein n=1 Tax=Deinococcus aestuarii TaxID=2774531 RepID=UPI001C0DD834|nr:hypothetical protein [Deinococcus aestuarii]